MANIDINTVINTLVGEYVECNANYVKALESERAAGYTFDTTIERLELYGVVQGLTRALVVLGVDVESVDSRFSIDGV